MFRSARVKLTAWYLLIILLVSISFSVVVYRVLTSELDRVERLQRIRSEVNFAPRPPEVSPRNLREELAHPFRLDPELIAETKRRLALTLAFINLIIVGTSAAAGYFLAGRTLSPIAQMMDEQKEFISDASHELRTPLTSLKSEIQVALRDKKLSLTQAKTLLESNLEEANKMQNLSNYLLTLHRYQSHTAGLLFKQINLKDVAEKAVEKIEKLAKTKNIKITKKLAKVEVKGNEDALIELVTILLDNAIKYSLPFQEAIIKIKKEGNEAILEVQDFGIGIKKEDIPHVFNRFYQAESSRSKEKTDGYGLGLSIAKSIVDLHQGKILITSSPKKGSIFTIKLSPS